MKRKNHLGKRTEKKKGINSKYNLASREGNNSGWGTWSKMMHRCNGVCDSSITIFAGGTGKKQIPRRQGGRGWKRRGRRRLEGEVWSSSLRGEEVEGAKRSQILPKLQEKKKGPARSYAGGGKTATREGVA